jgi:ParB/RepB/Spo0J family partition protein
MSNSASSSAVAVVPEAKPRFETECVEMIPLAEVTVLPNPRKRIGDLTELKASIGAQGVQSPVVVRKGAKGFELVFGQRRYLATKELKLQAIPALVRKMTDTEVLEAQLIENGQRVDIHPMERAEAFEQLRKTHKLSVEEIANRVGVKRGDVLQSVKLCELTPAARKAFFEGKFNAEVAFLLARVPADLQKEALDDVLQQCFDGESPRTPDILHLIHRKYMLSLADAPFDKKDEALVPSAGSCAACPKRTGNQNELFGDVKAKDTCTDPLCFQAKLEADWKRRCDAAREKDVKVLTDGEAKKLFARDSLTWDTPYVDLDQLRPEDSKRRTWRKLLEKAMPQVHLARDMVNRSHELVLKKDALKALQQLGHAVTKVEKICSISKETAANHDGRREAEAKQRAANALRGKVVTAAMAKLRDAAASGKPDAELFRLLVHGLLRGSWHDTVADTVRRRGLREKGAKLGRPEDVLEKLVPELKLGELVGLAVELIAGRGAFWSGAGGYGQTFTEACKVYDVDLKKVMAEVKKPATAPLEAKK